MTKTRRHVVVLVTAPHLRSARALARVVLGERLVACANLVPGVESHYWWEGRLTKSREVLLILKTTPARLPALEQAILSAHPYETPEIIVLGLQTGNDRFLRWIDRSVQSA